MRIVIDLDGTICEIKRSDQSYEDLRPIPGAVERIAMLRAEGHYIIISTARNMQTCNGNLGKVMKNVAKITLDWLDRHGIAYDEIFFGKPNADVYIDDRSIRFTAWDEINSEALEKVAKSR